MPDPYAPAGPPRAAVSEVRSPLEQFTQRLRDLGATADEVQAVADHWDDLDDDDSTEPDAFTRARREQLTQASDDKLLELIAASRDEYEVGTTTEDEAADKEAAAAYQAALAEAQGRIGGNVDSVLAWVADDRARAQAVYDLETADTGAGRKTLVGPLTELLDHVPEPEPEPGAEGDQPEREALHVDIEGPLDLEADTLGLGPDDLPTAEVGDTVLVHAGDTTAQAYVAEFDPIDGHPILRWAEAAAEGEGEGHAPPVEQAAEVAALGDQGPPPEVT